MKNLFLALAAIAMLCFAVFGATNYGVYDATTYSAGNVRVIKLGTCNSSALDSLNTGEANIYGPYNMAFSATRPSFAGLQFYSEVSSIAAGDSISVGYQIIAGDEIGDTVASGWTEVDTIKGVAGLSSPYTDISSTAGKKILFRLLNYDADSCVINAPIRVFMKESMTASPDTKH